MAKRSGYQTTDLAGRMNEAARQGGGIRPKTADDKPTVFDRVVGVAGKVGRKVFAPILPKPPVPVGNSQLDAHNQRAHEFSMSEAEREKAMRRLDRVKRNP